ncbi:MAG: hypothetical protein HWE14_12580 [Flavobacteriia bacterium]|nr:hypothetical protein [Flavobacteriia bacterium]
MNIKTLFLLGLMVLAIPGYAQEFVVPDASNPENSDMASHRDDAKACANYLLTVEYDKNDVDIKKAAAYLLMWVSNTSDFNIHVAQPMVDYGSDKNAHLMMVFIAGWTNFALDNLDEGFEDADAAVAGFMAVNEYYLANDDEFRETDEIENLQEKIEEDEIREWAAKLLEEA